MAENSVKNNPTKSTEGGVSTQMRYVFRNKDSFFRNEFGQKDLHLLLRFVCIIIGTVSSSISLFVFFNQAMGVISTKVDALPYFYNALFFMLSAVGDAALESFKSTKKKNKK